MKPLRKKIIGGLLVCMMLAGIGAVFAAAQTTDTTDDDTILERPQPLWGRFENDRFRPFAGDLTEEQQLELEQLISNLIEQNATPDELHALMQEKLDEFGVLDSRLDQDIAQTEQRLTILTRQKELRNEGYSWDDITTIIQEEFDLANTTGFGQDHMGGPQFGRGPHGGPCGGPHEFMSSEETNQ
ncbi:MAG: hypothetical protein JXA00_06380 [Candidatus Thermoplasmatota archaeon]|nr:hypothetical protein [Candidatus Thermoplasmatota archaeon]